MTSHDATLKDDASTPHDADAHGGGHGSLGALALAALGVVFGDIGTSPLYALKECIARRARRRRRRPTNVLGVLSLIFWSLTMVVTVKYLTFIMRADNQGEGGILALLALVPEKLRGAADERIGWIAVLVRRRRRAALRRRDRSRPRSRVLSAVEGLEVATHRAQARASCRSRA